MEFKIKLTWSKIVALIVLIAAFGLDYYIIKGNSTFMFSLPFVVFLITGKQYLDKK